MVVVYIPPKNVTKDAVIKRMTRLANEYEMSVICNTDKVHLKVKPEGVNGVDLKSSPIKIPKYFQINKGKTPEGKTNLSLTINGRLIEVPHPLFGKSYVFGILVDDSQPKA